MKNISTDSFRMGLQGIYKVAVVDGITGQEVWKQENWGKNLILNQGMDRLASDYLANVTTYGVAGTGTRFNDVSSGDSSGSVIGGIFGLTTGATGIQDLNSTTYGGWVGGVLAAGDVIKFYDGTEITVVGSIGALTATVTPTATIGSQSFAIWKTSQTGLQTEVKRAGSSIPTSSYLAGGCGTTFNTSSGLVTHLRTYDFGSESFTRDYSEVGVGWGVRSAIPNVFSRIALPQTVSVVSGQRLRLIYSLLVNFSPTSSVKVINVPISGWPNAPATNTNVIQCIQRFDGTTVSQVNSDGSSATGDRVLEPAGNDSSCYMWGSIVSGSPSPMGSWTDRSAGNDRARTLKVPYVTGSYECYKYYTFTVSQISTSSIASFGIGYDNPGSNIYSYNSGQGFCIAFEQTQSKTNTQTLTMYFKWNWGRILS